MFGASLGRDIDGDGDSDDVGKFDLCRSKW